MFEFYIYDKKEETVWEDSFLINDNGNRIIHLSLPDVPLLFVESYDIATERWTMPVPLEYSGINLTGNTEDGFLIDGYQVFMQRGTKAAVEAHIQQNKKAKQEKINNTVPYSMVPEHLQFVIDIMDKNDLSFLEYSRNEELEGETYNVEYLLSSEDSTIETENTYRVIKIEYLPDSKMSSSFYVQRT